MLFSLFHVPHVLLILTICFGFQALLSRFPCIPFPGLLLPPQATGSFQSILLHDQVRETEPFFKEQDGEREQRGHPTGCDVLKEREGSGLSLFGFVKTSIAVSSMAEAGRVELQRGSVAVIRKLPGLQAWGQSVKHTLRAYFVQDAVSWAIALLTNQERRIS